MQISRDRIRLQLANNPKGNPSDVLRSSAPAFVIGNDLAVELALFLDDQAFQTLADISDVATLTLDLKPINSKRSLPVMSATLSSGDLNPALTLQEWQTSDPLKYHALFTFVNGLTAIELNADEQDYWFTVYAWTNDTVPRKVTWGCGSITLIDDGSNAAPPAFVVSPTYVTLAQGNALWGAGNTGNKVNKTGDVMSGALTFSGTTHQGIKLNNLTTTQRTAITGAAGMFPFDSTVGLPYFHDGSAWRTFVTKINGSTGDVTLQTSDVAEHTSLYFTTARVLATAITGFSAGAGVVAATDTILQAINKLAGNQSAGSVTSVALTAPAGFSVSGSPVTGSGTLALSLSAQAPNKALIGPISGASATPTFRLLDPTDIPALAISGITGLSAALAALLPLAGGTLTGVLNLVAGTPSGQQATSFAFINATYAPLASPTFTGTVSTADLTVNSGNVAQWGGTPSSAAHLVNKTYADTKAALAGATFTGGIAFNGTTFAGVKLNNLNDTQVTALTPTSGMLLWNTTVAQVQVYTGTVWQALNGVAGGGGGGAAWYFGSGAPSSGLGIDGSFYIDTATGNIYNRASGTWSIVYGYSATGALLKAGGTMTGNIVFSGTSIPGLVLNNLTTTQAAALISGGVPNGAIAYDTVYQKGIIYNGSVWNVIVDSTGGNHLTGSLFFAGNNFAAIGLNAQSTTNVNLIGSLVAGLVTYDSTLGAPVFYNGSVWGLVGKTGITNGSAPASGEVGETLTASILSGVGVALTNNTNANVTSISLPAGRWLVSGIVNIAANNPSTLVQGQIGLTTTTTATEEINIPVVQLSVNDFISSASTPAKFFNFSTTTTVYLATWVLWTAGGAHAYGRITATRI